MSRCREAFDGAENIREGVFWVAERFIDSLEPVALDPKVYAEAEPSVSKLSEPVASAPNSGDAKKFWWRQSLPIPNNTGVGGFSPEHNIKE